MAIYDSNDLLRIETIFPWPVSSKKSCNPLKLTVFSNFNLAQFQEPETDTDTASERKWQQVQEQLDLNDARDRRHMSDRGDYRNYSYHESDYIDNNDRGWEEDRWRDQESRGRGYYDRSMSGSWDRRWDSYYSGHDTFYDRSYYRSIFLLSWLCPFPFLISENSIVNCNSVQISQLPYWY